MHDHSTRVSQNHHRSAASAATVVAVLFLVAAVTALAPRIAHSAPSGDIEVSGIPQIGMAAPAPYADHDIAIETVPQGQEGLELSVRLTDEGNVVGRPVSWQVTTADGETVYADDIAVAEFPAEPGDYIVDIRYGAVHAIQSVTLVPGSKLSASFILNAGGIRVLPRVQNIGLPALQSESLVYALMGSEKGRLIGRTEIPGEILRVPAGEYRIVSRFPSGNVNAVSDVTVKAGLMSAVEFDHAAGLVHLNLPEGAAKAVRWTISDASGNVVEAQGSGHAAEAVLKPGSYTAVAEAAGQQLTASFSITAGEYRDVTLAP